MIRRIITAMVLAPVAIALILLLPASLFAEIVMLLMIIGLFEWDGLTTHSNTGFILAAMGVLVAGIVLYLLSSRIIANQDPAILLLVSLAGACFWLLQIFTLVKGIEYRRSAVVELVLGMLAVLCAWAGMVWLRLEGSAGTYMVLIAIVVVWAADTFAYFAGTFFGRHKLMPSISPGKTIEGVIGGMAGAVFVAWVGARALLNLDQSQTVAWLSAAAAGAAISVAGDLYVSRLKRQAGVKDSGKLLPGHGGILDRIDGLIAAMPVFASVWWLLR
jgi:phosphatidate cytidylyltransferase